MDAATKIFVRLRGGDRCEYCRSSQVNEPFFRFQIEHIIAKQHGGGSDDGNLALACPHCNQHKGPNLAGLDPLDGTLTPLFHPRTNSWDEHFEYLGPQLIGLTAVGRTTIAVLNINDPLRVELRAVSRERSISSSLRRFFRFLFPQPDFGGDPSHLGVSHSGKRHTSHVDVWFDLRLNFPQQLHRFTENPDAIGRLIRL